jgi:hypothetical protein
VSKHKIYLYNPGNFGDQEFQGVWPNTHSPEIEWSRSPQDIAVFIDSDGQHHWDGSRWFLPNLHNAYNEANAKLNIFVLIEPRELCPRNYEWVLQYKDFFNVIYTPYPDFGDGSSKFVYWKGVGRTYVPEQHRQIYPKFKNIAAIFSDQMINNMDGYTLRRDIKQSAVLFPRVDFNNPLELWNKHEGVKDYRYEIVVKNEDYPTFQEKLIDCLLVGSIPIYWTSKTDYLEGIFDLDGFVFFESIQQLEQMIRDGLFTAEHYESKKKAIEYNFNAAKNYTSLGDTLLNQGMRELIENSK